MKVLPSETPMPPVGEAVDSYQAGKWHPQHPLFPEWAGSGIGASLIESLTFGRVPIPMTADNRVPIASTVDGPHTFICLLLWQRHQKKPFPPFKSRHCSKGAHRCVTSEARCWKWQKLQPALHPNACRLWQPRAVLGYAHDSSFVTHLHLPAALSRGVI